MEHLFKTDKITRILMLYHQLINGQHINKTLFSWEHGINERSFDRDIEDLRLFLSEIYSAREIQYNKETGTYFLTGEHPMSVERMDATIIAKILLDSKTLRKDEMCGLYNSLINATFPKDASAINRYLQYDISEYCSNTRMALLKTLGDLYSAIESGVDIEMALNFEDCELKYIKVSPLNIKIENSRFCLIAAESMNISRINSYSIDKIDSFTTLQTSFARLLQQQYRKQEIHDKNNIKEIF